MALSRNQQILLKRAQKHAGLTDDDYRAALEIIAGCRSSTSPTLTNRHLDKILAYFEAIYWRSVDAAAQQPSCSGTSIFRRRGYWAQKNTNQETSRDRFTGQNLGQTIADREAQLVALGFDANYCAAIRTRVIGDRTSESALYIYSHALDRTLKAIAKREGRAAFRTAKALAKATAALISPQ